MSDHPASADNDMRHIKTVPVNIEGTYFSVIQIPGPLPHLATDAQPSLRRITSFQPTT